MIQAQTQKSRIAAAHRKPPLRLDFGSPARTRTTDKVINSHPLTCQYRLDAGVRRPENKLPQHNQDLFESMSGINS